MSKMFDMGYRNYIYSVNREGFVFSPRIFSNYPNTNSYFATFAALAKTMFQRIPRKTPAIIQPSLFIFNYFDDCNWKLNCICEHFSLINEYPILLQNSLRRLAGHLDPLKAVAEEET